MGVTFPITAKELSEILGCSVQGDQGTLVRRFSALEEATAGSLSFFESKKFIAPVSRLKDCILLTTSELANTPTSATFLVVEAPQRKFYDLISKFLPVASLKGVHPTAIVSGDCKLGENCYVGPFVVIGKNVSVGASTQIHAFSYIGNNVTIGTDCLISPHVSLLDETSLGSRVRIMPGTVIGSDGFGLLPPAPGHDCHYEIPQIGSVEIRDFVRIGSNSTIDRGSLGTTLLEKGTKLDNQVHIAHNCKVGAHSILCAQAALAGSVTLKENVVLGGQVGVADHVTIESNVQVGGQAGVGTNLEGNQMYSFTPAVPVEEGVRAWRYLRRLPTLVQTIKEIEKKIKSLGL